VSASSNLDPRALPAEAARVKALVSDALFPFSSHFLDLGGGLQMHYLDEGPRDAPVVLMVHGNPSWSFYYRSLVMALRGDYRVIVPCHIGCGLSDKPDKAEYDFTLARRADDLGRLIDHLAIDSLSLVVHDWGGMIAGTWAVENPARVERWVVLNTSAFHLPAGKRVPPSLRLARLPAVGALLVRGLNMFVRGAIRSCVVRAPMPYEVANAYRAPYDSWQHRLAVHEFVLDIPLSENHESWQRVSATARGLSGLSDVPMMICWGMQDFVFDDDFLAEWLQRFPHAEVHRFQNAGHYILEDAPERVGRLVSEFLDRDFIEADVVDGEVADGEVVNSEAAQRRSLGDASRNADASPTDLATGTGSV
jgi:haloalkane dehalogenase